MSIIHAGVHLSQLADCYYRHNLRKKLLSELTLTVWFCRQFEDLYGAERCTPNMHMACHLKDCMLDYSVLSAFWCFPFERMNGILEGMKKSWVSPEKQMFSKFINLQSLSTFTAKEHNSDF